MRKGLIVTIMGAALISAHVQAYTQEEIEAMRQELIANMTSFSQLGLMSKADSDQSFKAIGDLSDKEIEDMIDEHRMAEQEQEKQRAEAEIALSKMSPEVRNHLEDLANQLNGVVNEALTELANEKQGE